MGKYLIIVESPTKAKHIGEMLGKEYKVLASFGHVRDLPRKELGIDVNNKFKPKYVRVNRKVNPLPQIKKAATEAETIYLASDPDREGEAIAWHIKETLPTQLRKKCKRITFKEITLAGVQNGLQNPRNIDIDLVNSQQARRILDRLAGFEISPMLWKKIKYKKGLSAGRVQSTALKIIYDRNNEIAKFKSKKYFTLHGLFEKFGQDIKTELIKLNGKKVEIKKEDIANKIVNDIKGGKFKVISLKRYPVFKKPPEPFETTTLIQEANRLLKFSSDKTMKIAQELFENGLITYMRTDSTRVAQEAKIEAAEYIKETYGNKYLGNLQSTGKTGSQDAHEAIRPTTILPFLEYYEGMLTKEQYALYSLIYKRFLASQMAPAEYLEIEVLIEGLNKKKGLFREKVIESVFRTRKQFMEFSGYRKLYVYKEKKEDVALSILNKLQINEELKEKDIFAMEHETEPPKNYTEASLIKTLDKLGIGRPSTYSNVIKTLISREYIKLENKKLTITSLGKEVIEVINGVFPIILDPDFTASMEKELDNIATGNLGWEEVVNKFYKQIQKAKAKMKNLEIREE